MKRYLWLSLIGVALYFCYGSSKPTTKAAITYTALPLHFFPGCPTPYIRTKIEGKSLAALVDLGSSHPLDLQKSFLEKISAKTPVSKKEIYRDFQGKTYEVSSFLLPSFHITASLRANNVSVYEEDPLFLSNGRMYQPSFFSLQNLRHFLQWKWVQGRIGWPLFSVGWCWLDLERKQILLAPSQDALPYTNWDSWLQTPFSIEPFGLCIDLATTKGTKRFLLDTGSSHSVSKEKDTWSTLLQIGERIVCHREFLPFPMDQSLTSLDGILGMDFFQDCSICFDFSQKILYLNPKEKR